MSAPTHIEVTIYAMTCDMPDHSRLADRGDDVHFYDVLAQRVESDLTHPDWTGEIDILEEAENIENYAEAVGKAVLLCLKYGLGPHDWVDEGG